MRHLMHSLLSTSTSTSLSVLALTTSGGPVDRAIANMWATTDLETEVWDTLRAFFSGNWPLSVKQLARGMVLRSIAQLCGRFVVFFRESGFSPGEDEVLFATCVLCCIRP